jgi:hypothetical protein
MATKARGTTQMHSKREPVKGGRTRKVAKTKVTETVTAPAARKQARKAVPAVKTKAGFSVLLKDVLTTVPDSARDGFVRTVVGDPSDGLDAALWGRGPSPAERKEAALANLRRQYESRRQVVDASLTRAEAAELLDISEQAVLDRLEAGDLIGLKKGREWRLPAWQFSADAERGFVPGLAKLREVFPGGAVSMTEWVTSPNVELDGATPADELAAGHVVDVVHAAAAGTAAAW